MRRQSVEVRRQTISPALRNDAGEEAGAGAGRPAVRATLRAALRMESRVVAAVAKLTAAATSTAARGAPRVVQRAEPVVSATTGTERATNAQSPPLPPRQLTTTQPSQPSQPSENPVTTISPVAGPSSSQPPPPPSSRLEPLSPVEANDKALKAEPSKAEEEFLRLLECPVCLETMCPPIEQCCKGHSVCGPCRRRLLRCPLCRGGWSGVRCVPLENIVERLVGRACKHAERGCTQCLQGEELTRHEAACPWRPARCMVCAEEVALKELNNHVLRRHKGNRTTNGEQRMVHQARPGVFSFFLVEVHGALFWLWRRYSPRFVYVGVDAIADSQEIDRFRVAIEVQSADKQCTLRWEGPVHAAKDHVRRSEFDPCDKCLMTPSALMKTGASYTVNITHTKPENNKK